MGFGKLILSLLISLMLAMSSAPAFAMVGGTVHPLGLPKFPATIKIKNWCTAAKIGPHTFLTAAHCLFDFQNNSGLWGENQKIEITNNPLPLLGLGYQEVTVTTYEVHPAFFTACTAAPCDFTSMLRVGADVGIFHISEETPYIPIASIDTAPIPDGTPVMLNGYGCEDYGHRDIPVPSDPTNFPDGRLSYAPSVMYGDSLPTRLGVSPIGPELIYTPGPLRDPTKAGLCWGDSGGPVYYADGANLTIVGVNASLHAYSNAGAASGNAFNVHSKLSVASWILGYIN